MIKLLLIAFLIKVFIFFERKYQMVDKFIKLRLRVAFGNFDVQDELHN